ncbi:MAG: phosphatidate cytidylyltransferase [Nitrospirae bacterium]|nr:phosphatidate cytidylyltransferase [Nitrospirota bacterium]
MKNAGRLTTAAIVLPPLIAYIYFLPPFPFFLALLAAVNILALREFYIMYKVPDKLYIPGLLTGCVLFYISCRHPAYFPDGIFISLFLLLVIRLFLWKAPSGCMSEIGPLGVGFFYVSFLSFQWFLRGEPSGLAYIFMLYASVWLADSLAYYIGKHFGKHKLYPAISPKKTIEGAFACVLGGAVGAVIIKLFFGLHIFTIPGAAAAGALLGIASMTGDLIESMFKRDAGVKDSGSLIPGHGGILDKIDGFLIAGPVLYILLRII